jgi:hypothetical protein
MDAASRRIVGFALGERHDAQLAYGSPAPWSPATSATAP